MAWSVKLQGKSWRRRLRDDHLELMRLWQPRLMDAYAKRVGGLLRGRTQVAVPKRTGRLRRGVKTRARLDGGFPLRGHGRVGSVLIDSTGPHANEGTVGLVEKAVGRLSRDKPQRALRNVVRGTLRKTAAERRARESGGS